MELINNAINYIRILTIVIIILVLLFGFTGVYILKFRKSRVVEKNVDYNQFKKEDSVEYVKFDDVCENMLVTDKGTRFIAAIKCSGINYMDAEAEEKLQVVRGFLTFFNVLDNQRIQFRQSARDVNLDEMISDYQAQLSKLTDKQFLLNMEYEDTKLQSEREDITPEEYDIYFNQLKEMQKELLSLGYQTEQLKMQIQYMQNLSGDKADPHRDEIYVFDWSFNKLDFANSDLSEAEIYAKADKHLKNQANSYTSALRNAGVKAKLIKGIELLEEIRRYTHPISSSKSRVDDILASAYDSIIVTSNSLRDLEEQVSKKAMKEIVNEVEKDLGKKKV